jgi:hypothetical protein
MDYMTDNIVEKIDDANDFFKESRNIIEDAKLKPKIDMKCVLKSLK